MKGKETIELTPQELEEIKDEIRFREKVTLSLKALNGLPDRVTRTETAIKILVPIVLLILSGLVGLGFMVFH